MRRIGSWIIIGAPALWVALEYIRANLFFLSCPWTLLGHSQYLYIPVIQIADITGVYGISFILVMLNQLLSQGLEYFFKKKHFIWPADFSFWQHSRQTHIIIASCSVFFILLLQFGPTGTTAE